jgi:hypothetical protein
MKSSTIALRILSLIFCNLKLLWIGLFLATICNIHFSIRAANVGACEWYWGETVQYTDDDYIHSLNIADNNNGNMVKMTCNNQTCADVCSGSCTTSNYYGDTLPGESFTSRTDYLVCTITFRWLEVIFVLTVVALSFASLVELVLGLHMVYLLRYPETKWYFLKNLHLPSIWSSLFFAFRPGFVFRYILDNSSDEIYPNFQDIPPVPYYIDAAHSLATDFPFLISTIFWILFSTEGLSIFLFFVALANFLLNFYRIFLIQFWKDIHEDIQAEEAEPLGYTSSEKHNQPLLSFQENHSENPSYLPSVVLNS